MTRRKPGAATKAREPLSLDDSPLGRAWSREIEDRRNRRHPNTADLEDAVARLPLAVKSGTLPWPAHWSPVPPLRLVRPALANTATDAEIAGCFVTNLIAARVTPVPTENERQRARLVGALAAKVRGLRSEVHALGLTERDLFALVAYHEPADGMRGLRDAIGPTRRAVLDALSDRPGSAMTVLDALAPAATHAFLPPRMWNPADPPRAQATATLDALLCVLSVFVPAATIDMATRCTVACYPADERGIRKRAAKYLALHRPELRSREGLSWGAGELSPLIPLDSSVTA